jgi:hypothetical protein
MMASLPSGVSDRRAARATRCRFEGHRAQRRFPLARWRSEIPCPHVARRVSDRQCATPALRVPELTDVDEARTARRPNVWHFDRATLESIGNSLGDVEGRARLLRTVKESQGDPFAEGQRDPPPLRLARRPLQRAHERAVVVEEHLVEEGDRAACDPVRAPTKHRAGVTVVTAREVSSSGLPSMTTVTDTGFVHSLPQVAPPCHGVRGFFRWTGRAHPGDPGKGEGPRDSFGIVLYLVPGRSVSLAL